MSTNEKGHSYSPHISGHIPHLSTSSCLPSPRCPVPLPVSSSPSTFPFCFLSSCWPSKPLKNTVTDCKCPPYSAGCQMPTVSQLPSFSSCSETSLLAPSDSFLLPSSPNSSEIAAAHCYSPCFPQPPAPPPTSRRAKAKPPHLHHCSRSRL